MTSISKLREERAKLMKWTKEAPSQAGYYWLFDGDTEEPELVRIIQSICHFSSGLEIVRLGSEVHDSVLLGHYAEERGCSMYWFGPLNLNAPDDWKDEVGILKDQL